MNNYSIKYAVMPIYKQTGWVTSLNFLGRDHNTVCNIVSPCYVVSEIKSYQDNGEFSTKYEVVFPYNVDSFNNDLDINRIVPEFNFNYECVNSIFLKEVFDSYEEASISLLDLNDEKFASDLACLPIDNDFLEIYKRKRKEFQEKIEKYKEIETKIFDLSSDLVKPNKALIKTSSR